MQLPASGGRQSVDAAAAHFGQTVHEPNGILAGRLVLPQDVKRIVAVKITETPHLPGLFRYPRQTRRTEARAVHRPDAVVAIVMIAPEQVRSVVAVEITTTNQLPPG